MERVHERFREFVTDFWNELLPWEEVRWTDPRILALLIVRGTQTLETCPHIDPRIERDLRDHLHLWMRELPHDETVCDTTTMRDRLAAHAERPMVLQTFSDEDAGERFRRRVSAFENIGNAYVLHRSPGDAAIALQHSLRDADGALDSSEVLDLIAPLVELMGIAAALTAFGAHKTEAVNRLRSASDLGTTLRLAQEVF
ncbi:MAG: hypothetical protein Q7S89_00755 [bacterium]|nr:hypothetical protein [bacterium]